MKEEEIINVPAVPKMSLSQASESLRRSTPSSKETHEGQTSVALREQKKKTRRSCPFSLFSVSCAVLLNHLVSAEARSGNWPVVLHTFHQAARLRVFKVDKWPLQKRRAGLRQLRSTNLPVCV